MKSLNPLVMGLCFYPNNGNGSGGSGSVLIP